MGAFLRFVFGILLLPACWGVSVALVGVLSVSCRMEACSLAFLGGVLAFVFCWILLSHPVKTYVLGHELTHALWGLLFGAVPSKLRVRSNGGSVNLTKSNLLITLAPYFFPFYAVLVVLAAVLTSLFVRPLPCVPLWVFLVGFAWSFHVLFTFDSLMESQPDVNLHGRVFSWPFIFIANVLVVLAGLTFATDYGFASLGRLLCRACASSYVGCWHGGADLVSLIVHP